MLHNQICLLTGATGGIGQAVAKLLDKQGCKLILQGRNQQKLADLLADLSGKHQIVVGDLVNAKARKDIIEQAFSDSAGAPTMLINNAGVSAFEPLMESTQTDIEDLVAMNLTATMDLTRMFLQRCIKACTIVNVGSAFGAIGYPGYTVYCATKFGLRGFTEALARELSGSDHRICYFAPRATKTAINSSEVEQMNVALGNQTDSAQFVAYELLKLLKSAHNRRTVGWPEKFFTRLNGFLPELVDKSINKQSCEILNFAKGKQI